MPRQTGVEVPHDPPARRAEDHRPGHGAVGPDRTPVEVPWQGPVDRFSDDLRREEEMGRQQEDRWLGPVPVPRRRTQAVAPRRRIGMGRGLEGQRGVSPSEGSSLG